MERLLWTLGSRCPSAVLSSCKLLYKHGLHMFLVQLPHASGHLLPLAGHSFLASHQVQPKNEARVFELLTEPSEARASRPSVA
eukprot:2041444-Amphidinium_carterae.1